MRPLELLARRAGHALCGAVHLRERFTNCWQAQFRAVCVHQRNLPVR